MSDAPDTQVMAPKADAPDSAPDVSEGAPPVPEAPKSPTERLEALAAKAGAEVHEMEALAQEIALDMHKSGEEPTTQAVLAKLEAKVDAETLVDVEIKHGSYHGGKCADESARTGRNKGFGYDDHHPALVGERVLVAGVEADRLVKLGVAKRP